MNRQYAAPVPPVSIWLALAALGFSPASGSAQSQTEQPQFDAASVKVNESADRPSTRFDPVRVDLRKASIKHLIRRAWPLPDYQIAWPDGSTRSAARVDTMFRSPSLAIRARSV
jgi:hypothetical protein